MRMSSVRESRDLSSKRQRMSTEEKDGCELKTRSTLTVKLSSNYQKETQKIGVRTFFGSFRPLRSLSVVLFHLRLFHLVVSDGWANCGDSPLCRIFNSRFGGVVVPIVLYFG